MKKKRAARQTSAEVVDEQMAELQDVIAESLNIDGFEISNDCSDAQRPGMDRSRERTEHSRMIRNASKSWVNFRNERCSGTRNK